MKKEIENSEDVKLLVDSFYEKVRNSEIGFLFDDVAKVHWESHLPVMYSFWETTIFAEGSYRGNPIEKHEHLNKQEKLTPEHFKIWTGLFTQTVDELFTGENAERAKQRASSIAMIMNMKVQQSNLF